jgi:hypothetical protein
LRCNALIPELGRISLKNELISLFAYGASFVSSTIIFSERGVTFSDFTICFILGNLASSLGIDLTGEGFLVRGFKHSTKSVQVLLFLFPSTASAFF